MNKKQNNLVTISQVDIQIAVAIGICLLAASIIPGFQAMTACIATLLCVQTGVKESWKAGLIRLIVTAVGGVAGILVILADNAANNKWLFIILTMLGVLLSLWGCKMARAPLFNARIGGVTFILVVLTKTGSDRIDYALLRFLSTIYGVAIVIIVTLVFSFFTKTNTQKKN